MKGSEKSNGFLGFILFLGAICGSLLGDFVGSKFVMFNFLKNSYAIGTSTPVILNLKVLTLTLGLNFNINIMTIIGIIMAIILYRKY